MIFTSIIKYNLKKFSTNKIKYNHMIHYTYITTLYFVIYGFMVTNKITEHELWSFC